MKDTYPKQKCKICYKAKVWSYCLCNKEGFHVQGMPYYSCLGDENEVPQEPNYLMQFFEFCEPSLGQVMF